MRTLETNQVKDSSIVDIVSKIPADYFEGYYVLDYFPGSTNHGKKVLDVISERFAQYGLDTIGKRIIPVPINYFQNQPLGLALLKRYYQINSSSYTDPDFENIPGMGLVLALEKLNESKYADCEKCIPQGFYTLSSNIIKAFKEHPAGLFPGVHEPIVDMVTWKMVQSKLKKPTKHRTIIDDAIPLRGLLKCHCGNFLTGAASRGKSGKYFHYYKCRFSKHNNISAKKAHDQFDKILELMSLPSSEITKIRTSAKEELQQELDNNRNRLTQKKSELEAEKALLYSIEEKYIKNEIDQETYRRWFNTYKEKIDVLETAVLRLGNTSNEAFNILDRRMDP